MNEFRLRWKPNVHDELADAWLRASNRDAVTKAQAEIDRLLSGAPFSNGRELSEGLYRIKVEPLVVYYTIDEAKHQVTITGLRFLPQ